MKDIILTPSSLSLDGHLIPLLLPPKISGGIKREEIAGYAHKNEYEFAQQLAHREGFEYAQLHTSITPGEEAPYVFGIGGAATSQGQRREVHPSEIRARMGRVGEFTKFLGVDLSDRNANGDLKQQIDDLELPQLETLIQTTGFVDRRSAEFGPSGVIILMTDLYNVKCGY